MKTIILTVVLSLAAITFAACGQSATNSNSAMNHGGMNHNSMNSNSSMNMNGMNHNSMMNHSEMKSSPTEIEAGVTKPPATACCARPRRRRG